MTINQCNDDGCAFIQFESNIQQHQITLPLITTHQNGREYYSSTVNINEILKFADIPALNFGLDNNQFCEYTQNDAIAIIAGGGQPGRWQRVTKQTRVNGMGAWLAGRPR